MSSLPQDFRGVQGRGYGAGAGGSGDKTPGAAATSKGEPTPLPGSAGFSVVAPLDHKKAQVANQRKSGQIALAKLEEKRKSRRRMYQAGSGAVGRGTVDGGPR